MSSITECSQCGAKYNTADMSAGKHLKCQRCGNIMVVGMAVDIVNVIVNDGIRMGASDVHIEPLEDNLRIRYRIDGVLILGRLLDKDMEPKILSRIKVLSQVDIAERRRHQDGRFQITVGGREIDLRMSSFVTVHGENIVLRILNREIGLVTMDKLGLPPALFRKYVDMTLASAAGVVVITGPTGSGKTTTLYSSISHCNNEGVKIITAEDPVEYQIDGIMQCSINEKIGLTYDDTLRAIVRQDPDIIVLGEVRDVTSAKVAIQAALTGHKVFTTFHTEDSIGAILRLSDMDIETFLIASTVICVVAQRLVRAICPHCKEEVKPRRREVEILGIEPKDIAGFKFYRGRGCEKCHNTGYLGRQGIFEMLFMEEAVKAAVMDRKPSYQIRQICMQEGGLISMQEAGIVKVLEGETTFEEIIRSAPRSLRPRAPKELFELLGKPDPRTMDNG